MLNKRGLFEGSGKGWVIAILIITGIVAIIVIGEINITDTTAKTKENMAKGSYGFEEVLTINGQKTKSLSFLNFIFGRIPIHLIEIIGEGTQEGRGAPAALIMIAIWIAFFLIFADIMNLFAPFSPWVNWTIGGVMALIGANLGLLSIMMVYSLTVLAIFGAISVLFSLFSVFGLFIAFHFGSTSVRKWIILRRAEERALKAVAGGKEAGGAIKALKEIAEDLIEKPK